MPFKFNEPMCEKCLDHFNFMASRYVNSGDFFLRPLCEECFPNPDPVEDISRPFTTGEGEK